MLLPVVGQHGQVVSVSRLVQRLHSRPAAAPRETLELTRQNSAVDFPVGQLPVDVRIQRRYRTQLAHQPRQLALRIAAESIDELK